MTKSLKVHPCACATFPRLNTSAARLVVTFSEVAAGLPAFTVAPPDPSRLTHAPFAGSVSVAVTAKTPGPSRTVWLFPDELACARAAFHAATRLVYVTPSTVISPLMDDAVSAPWDSVAPVTERFAVELFWPLMLKALLQEAPFQMSYSHPELVPVLLGP